MILENSTEENLCMKIPYNWLKEYLKPEALNNITAKEVAGRLTMIGHALDKPIFEQGGDVVMDLEDRGNRADVTGILGIARDLSAVLEAECKEPEEGVLPSTNNQSFPIKISVESKRVIRWRAVSYKNIVIGESPEWIKNRLLSFGIEPKNNVVDITNFVMVETGMPSHAFDADKFDEIVLRQAKKGETLKTFDGGILEFDENDLLAASSTKPLTLTTAVGGEESGISYSTKNILIEAGLYDQPTARRSALRLNVRNETSGRLGKYLHPELCELAIKRIVYLMKELLDAEPENVSFDYYPVPYKPVSVKLTQKRLDMFAGSHVSLNEAEKILERLGFLIEGNIDGELTAQVPYFRTDVTMEDDVIEEVLRIRGYDKIPSNMISNPAPKKLIFNEMELEDTIKDLATRLGFVEVISLQMVDVDEAKIIKAVDENGFVENKFDGKREVVRLENSWNKELNILRTSIFESMYGYVVSYKKHHVEKIKLIETGKVYFKNSEKTGFEKYEEVRRVGLLSSLSFLELKAEVERLLLELGVPDIKMKRGNYYLFKGALNAEVYSGGEFIGIIGEVKESIVNDLKIGTRVSYCELSTSLLSKLRDQKYQPKPKTQLENAILEDFTFECAKESFVGEVIENISQKMPKGVSVKFKDLFIPENMGANKKLTITVKTPDEHLKTVRDVLNNYRM